MKARIAPPSGLPVQLTSFVGREPEMAELQALLRRERLVTIAGGAGLGKTRLAVEIASRAARGHPGGAWFACLAGVADPAHVAGEVAAALGVREPYGERAAELIAAHVGASRALLLLDNCEHLLDACAELTDGLLRSCPGLHVLATSREPLRVPGERVWRIAPLALPGTGGGADPDTLGRSEAVRLFVDRARLAQPRFSLAPGTAGPVAEICRCLDGIPLALELAAGRVEMMSVDEVLAQLDDRFRLLSAGRRTGPARHRTLRAAIDWGHQLLSPAERALLRRTSVFASAFDLAAAEAVCASPDLPLADVLGHLSGLVDKSFVVPEPAAEGRTRYRLLETVRQYAAERLLEGTDAALARLGHAEHFLALAEAAAAVEGRPAQVGWQRRLEDALGDLRAALEWCRAHDAARWVRLTTALGWFWVTRGHLDEGGRWLRAVLEVPSLGPAERARALYCLARVLYWQGDYGRARELASESLAYSRSLGERSAAGWTLNLLGYIRAYAGDHAGAAAALDEVLAAAVDDDLRLDTLIGIGDLLLQRGSVAEARGRLEPAVAIAARRDAPWQVGRGSLLLGIVAFLDRDYVQSRRRLAESLSVFHEVGNWYGLAGALDVFAALALAHGDPDRALRLSAGAAALRATISAALPAVWERLASEMVVQPARAAAGARADLAWARGSAMTVAELCADALGVADGAVVETAGEDVLSGRERQAAVLAARGLTNREIARRMAIAERTVESHLERVRGKLGVHSRAEVAVWVSEQGWLRPATVAGMSAERPGREP